MAEDRDYLRHRPLVLRIAYDITGSWVDAEDIAQQVYLRWRGTTTEIANPRAYLARIATNLALDSVARREQVGYPGPFLPEPVATGTGSDEALAMADEVEVALMVVLGTLSPLERAAFLLHDVFSFTHAEVAVMLGREPAAVRQLATRARRHVASRRPEPPPVDPQALVALVGRFLAASQRGDLEELTSYLTADAVFIGDGGGKRTATMQPVCGSGKVARLLFGLIQSAGGRTWVQPVQANHRAAVAIYEGDELDLIVWFVLREGQVDQVLVVRNPDKLNGGWARFATATGPGLTE